MYKKIGLLLFMLSPVLYSLFVGYPVVSENEYLARQAVEPHVAVSKRCFHVGDFDEFRQCFSRSQTKLAGRNFADEVLTKTNTISPIVSIILVAAFLVFVMLSVSLLLA